MVRSEQNVSKKCVHEYLTSPQHIVDAVGSWQIILPMPNLERAY